MQLRSARGRRAAALAAGCTGVLLTLPGSALAAGGYTVSITPGTSQAGQTTTFNAAFSTGNGGQDLGSANLFVPRAFAIKSASVDIPGAAVRVVGNEVELTGANGSTKSFTLSVTASTPDNCSAQNYSWSSEAYTGPYDNGSALTDLSTPAQESTSSANPCTVAFASSGEPADARNSTPITNTPYVPTGGPVLVDVLDGSGRIASSYNGPVSVSLTPAKSVGTGVGTLSGTTTVNAVNGVASFGNLAVDQTGNGYALAASGPAGTAATSSPFSIHNTGTTCPASGACSTDEQSSDWASNTPGAIDAAISSPGGTYLGVSQPFAILSETIDFGNWPAAVRQAECPDELNTGAHFFYGSFTDAAGNTVQRAFNASLTTRARTIDDVQTLVGGQLICFASNREFMAQTGPTHTLAPAPPVTLPDGTLGYAGELPTCTNAQGINNPTFPTVDPTTGPCVSDREGLPGNSVTGGTLTVKVSSPYDQWIN